MTISFCKPLSQVGQLLRSSPGWRCSYISSQGIPPLTGTYSLLANHDFHILALRRLHTNANLQDALPKPGENPQKRKRKGKTSLRRVAVEAQRSQETNVSEKSIASANQPITKVTT